MPTASQFLKDASEVVQSFLNGVALGSNSPFEFVDPGDYIYAEVLDEHKVLLGPKKQVAILELRVKEGRSEGRQLEAGERVIVKCFPAELQRMVERFHPAGGDVVAILYEGRRGRANRYQFTWNCEKASTPTAKEEEGW